MSDLQGTVAAGVHGTSGRLVRVAVVGTLGAGAAGALAALWSDSPDALLLIALVAVLGLPILLRFAGGRFDPLEPIVVFVAAYSVMFVVRPFAMLNQDGFAVVRTVGMRDVSTTFTEMLILALVGAAAFLVGYALPAAKEWARRLTPPPSEFHTDTVVVVAIAVAAIGLLAFGVLLVQAGGIGLIVSFIRGHGFREVDNGFKGSSYLYSASFVLAPTSLVLLAVGHVRRQGAIILAGIVIAGVLVLRALPEGTRMAFLPLAGGLIVYPYVARGTRPGLLALTCMATLALILSSWFLVVRSTGPHQGNPAGALLQIATHPVRLFEPLVSGGDAEMAPELAAALQIIPEQLPYTYGLGILSDLLVRPIPRALLPGKPLPPREEVVRTLWPVEYAGGYANPEFSVLLHFFRELGIVGVAIGMAAYGLMARTLYEYFLRHRRNLVAQLLFAAGLPFVVIALRDGPVDLFIRAVFMFLPIWFIFRVARQDRADPVRRPHPHGGEQRSRSTEAVRMPRFPRESGLRDTPAR